MSSFCNELPTDVFCSIPNLLPVKLVGLGQDTCEDGCNTVTDCVITCQSEEGMSRRRVLAHPELRA